jgi:hypothetical protein
LFGELINKAKELDKVVILIDEYDKPLVENIYASHIEEIRQVLKNFYFNIKASDKHLRFVFMTGVTKFAKVSVFSKLNNLEDITMDEKYATLYGYTHEEVECYFGDRLDAIAEKKKPSFIFKVIKQQEFDFYNEIKDEIQVIILDSFDVTNRSILPLLLQTGYLTIESGSWLMGQLYYKLNFPNFEIESAFQAYFVGSLEERSPIKVSSEIANLHR